MLTQNGQKDNGNFGFFLVKIYLLLYNEHKNGIRLRRKHE